MGSFKERLDVKENLPDLSSSHQHPDPWIRRLAWWLDSSLRIPGTTLRVGLDAIIGLIPWFGDVIGAAFSLVIIFYAWRRGVALPTLLRMFFNIAFETLLGVVPVVGDLFDFFWKANAKNLQLLEASLAGKARPRRDALVLTLGFVTVFAVLAGFLSLLVWAMYQIFNLVRELLLTWF